MGMKLGYREQEVAHMYYGKWNELFKQFVFYHNATMRKAVFEKKKVVSLDDLYAISAGIKERFI